MVDLKKMLAQSLAEQLNLGAALIERLIEVPPSKDLGDYALPCFALARKFKKKPNELASELSEKLSLPEGFSKMQAAGAYLNFFIDTVFLAKEVLSEIMEKKERYGASEIGKGKRVMVEYSQPNTNKPLHIGHLRNDSIGMSISNLFEFCGYDVIRANLMNDRGIHICKAMLAYKLFGNNETPQSSGMKGDALVGKYYVLFHQKAKEMPELNEKARELLRKWEAKDKETIALWKKLRDWVIEGFEQTYKRFGSRFDVVFFESDFYYKVKPIIEEGLAKGVFYKDEKGAIVAKLAPLPDKVVLREDGTSIYISNDLVLTKYKIEHYKLDLNIFVVASEQELYFKQLFKIFELLGYKWHTCNEHLSYGLVLLPEGKLKSREGKVIDADELIANITELARREILKRAKPNREELEKRALAIALAAIKFAMLKVDPKKNILFEPEKSISFEGSTGPYIQYSYARAKSILRKAGKRAKGIDYSLLSSEHEKAIIMKLYEFPNTVLQALNERKPNLICNYLIELCELFNSFYHKLPVLNSEPALREARLALVEATSTVIANGLRLLNIPMLEEM
ncbi:MAG: arginine--tRNA ligase [Candidatus Diapherotrites archaeon]|nr:arginine--tRNA ligase [Candidatus Diapherotrites archaeon]